MTTRTQIGSVDFITTRSLITRLPGWVDLFAARLPSPKRVPIAGSFRWEHTLKDAETLQVAKAVRIASGLRAAISLADMRHTVECGTLLRTISDFASEITFIGEGLMEGRFTDEQKRFVEQGYSSLPETPDELAAQERARLVGRRAIKKAFDRMSDKAGSDKEMHAKLSAFLSKGYDGYVHGHYPSAMELFTGRTMTFMMAGHESDRHVCTSKMAVAGKLKEGLNALRFMAMTRRMAVIAQELRDAFDELDSSAEDTSNPCIGLT
jgi:hypothetical protein